MNNITPEMIKVVAEGMGYKIHLSTKLYNNSVMVTTKTRKIQFLYNPLTIPAQNSEIEINLDISTYFIKNGLWQANIGKVYAGRGDTPAEARFMVAYHYFNKGLK